MNKLVTDRKITETGRDWLVAALDPFHDNQLSNLEGWPDVECGASVLRTIKKSIQLAVPAAVVAAGANWDCHIVGWPFLEQIDLTATLTRSGNLYTAGPAVAFGPVGGVQAYGMAAGSPLAILQQAGSNCAQIGVVEPGSTITKGSGRLVGMGFEIHNTTAELTRQGSLAVYRQMANAPDKHTYVGQNMGASPFIQTYTASTVRYPPPSLADAMQIQGSRQWNAEEGAYVVVAFSSDENPAYSSGVSSVVVKGSEDEEGVFNNGVMNVPRPLATFAGTTFSPVLPVKVHPIHQSGIIMTGLSYTTTLTLNVNYFYESFPSTFDLNILPLAKPSAKYDPGALEIYSRILQELPVGVPVRENGLGDWFMDAASKAAKYIGPILTALPHPVAKGAGAALTYLGNSAAAHKPKLLSASQPPNDWERKSGAVRERRGEPDWNKPYGSKENPATARTQRRKRKIAAAKAQSNRVPVGRKR